MKSRRECLRALRSHTLIISLCSHDSAVDLLRRQIRTHKSWASLNQFLNPPLQQHCSHQIKLLNDMSCLYLLSTRSGRHSDAAHEIRLIGCCILLNVVPKTVPGSTRLFLEPPRSPIAFR